MKKSAKSIVIIFVFLSVLMLSMQPVLANDNSSNIAETNYVSIDDIFINNDTDISIDQRNLVIATTDNQILAVDRLVYFALRNIRLNVDFVTMLVAEGYSQADEGVVDGVIAAYPDLHTTRTNLIQVPVPLENNNIVVFGPDGSTLRINSWEELAGLRVGILENRTYILERLPENVVRTEKETNRALLNGLVNGEYDVAVLVERDHETLTDRHTITRVGQVGRLTEYLYIHKRHTSLIAEITSALEATKNNGDASRILNAEPIPEINQKRTIVHITSSTIETDREDNFNETLRGAFEYDNSIEWMTVNLDAKRFARDQHNMSFIASLLRTDCVSRNVAAVIVSGDVALDFLKEYYYLFFRNVPVVFYGVSEDYGDIIQDHPHFFTGIVKTVEAYETVQAALQIFPDTSRVFVVNDHTSEGVQYRNSIENELRPLEGSITIEYSENSTFDALLTKISSLPEDTLIFVGSYFIDADYQYYSMSEIKRMLERHCSVPILSVYSTDLAYNAIGGKSLDYHQYGLVVADMLDFLINNGGKAEDIPVIENSSELNRWVFDNNKMQIFGVSPSSLPAGSDIINAIPSIRESNPEYYNALIILTVISALLVAGASIFVIVTQKQNKLRSKLQEELALEKSMLETIFNSVPELLYVKDLDLNFVRVNKRFEEHFGCTAEGIVGKSSNNLALPKDLLAQTEEADRLVMAENQTVMVEGMVPDVSGNEPYFEILKTALYKNDKIAGVCCIAYDITHRKEMEDAAQAASRAKSNFLANMSHEMRTPLTVVLGLSELIIETTHLDEETHSNLVKIYRSGETLLFLINDILDISKIEANKMELHPIEYDVPSIINDAITQSILYSGEKPIELTLDINEDMPNYLFGDEIRIKQILNNLLSNAFKFTKEGTVELYIRCEKSGDDCWMTIRVSDTGVGIRDEHKNNLFSLYSKMEMESDRGGADRRTEGTGLGLSITKRIAELMDGSIDVDSEYGRGSIFTVKIKQKYVNDAVIGPKIVESLKNFQYSIDKFDNSRMTRINLSYAQVLVVDDNPTNLDVAKGLMGLYGMQVDCVSSGQQAVDAIREENVRYNAIFMDHMMPEMDGIEATQIIRKNIGTRYAKSIPIIALTANAIVGNEEIFLSKGFNAFISKPIELSHLDSVLRQWVRDNNAEALLPSKTIRSEWGRRKGKHKYEETVPGLNINKGIARFGFSEDSYFDVLRSYITNTRPLLEIIEKSDLKDLNEFEILVHGIKGASWGIFAENVGNMAEVLENAAKNSDRDFILYNRQMFCDTVLQLFKDMESSGLNVNKPKKPTMERPDKELLNKLFHACEEFDIDEIDATMNELDKFDYTDDDGLTSKLRNNLHQGKYIVVLEMLRAVL